MEAKLRAVDQASSVSPPHTGFCHSAVGYVGGSAVRDVAGTLADVLVHHTVRNEYAVEVRRDVISGAAPESTAVS